MIIIRLRSGLGNQMFQYAFFKQMQCWHGSEKVKIDVDTYHFKLHNGREIDKVFNIDFTGDTALEKESLALADVGYKMRHNILRDLRGRKHKRYKYWRDLELNDYRELKGDVYIEGYWNEECFFSDVKDVIRKSYVFSGELNEYQNQILSEIRNSESVGIHTRRGDYVKYPDLFPMCKPEYYYKAFEIIKAKQRQIKCFVFSDDLVWCKSNLYFLDNVTYVDNTVSEEAYKDMWFMSCCKHNIMANSTFSWWASWLNSNPEKIIIYPGSVKKNYNSMPDDWILCDY